MAIVLESQSTASPGPPGTTIDVTKPTGVSAGDVMVAVVGAQVLSSTTISPPSGWTQVAQLWVSQPVLGMWYRVADGNEGTSFQFSYSQNSSARRAGILRYSGVDNTTPIDVAANTNSGSSAAPRGLSVTTVTNDARLLMGLAFAQGNQSAAPTGMTEQFELDRVAFNDATQATAGASGDKDSTLSASNFWVTILTALRPAGAGAAGSLIVPQLHPAQVAALVR